MRTSVVDACAEQMDMSIRNCQIKDESISIETWHKSNSTDSLTQCVKALYQNGTSCF